MHTQQQAELRDVLAGLLTPVVRPIKLLTEPLTDDVTTIVKGHGVTIDPVVAGACYNTSEGYTQAAVGEWVMLDMTAEQAAALLAALQ